MLPRVGVGINMSVNPQILDTTQYGDVCVCLCGVWCVEDISIHIHMLMQFKVSCMGGRGFEVKADSALQFVLI